MGFRGVILSVIREDQSMRKLLLVIPLIMLGAGSTACATKKYVRGEVGQVNTKVQGLSTQLEETQERTKKNEARIAEVDQKADDAGKSATAAQSAADAAKGDAAKADAHAAAVESANKKLIYEVVLSEDSGNFKFGKTLLPDEAKQKIDEMVSQLKADPKNVFIEIEGHTDNVGSKDYNEKLGLERAEQVKRYLYEAHQIPLHKMNVISYGEEKPVSPNNTKEGRSQNRRVVIRVLA
jgi:outer membrane protein OmpA-like peptidoglycan-associated protein